MTLLPDSRGIAYVLSSEAPGQVAEGEVDHVDTYPRREYSGVDPIPTSHWLVPIIFIAGSV